MKKLLIVDDEPLARQVLCALVKRNFDDITIVAEAQNGTQAVELARQYRPHIIAMDVKMPGLNGIEASRQILADMPEVQIVILTAYNSFDYLREAFEIGVKGYLLKPINAQEFTDKIRSVSQEIDQRNIQLADAPLVSAAREIVEKELIGSLIHNSCTSQNRDQWQKYLQMNIQGGFFVAFWLSAGEQEEEKLPAAEYRQKIRKQISEVLNMGKPILIGEFTQCILPVFFPVSPSSNLSYARHEASLLAEEALRRLSVYCRVNGSAAVGNAYFSPGEYPRSYLEATSLLAEPIIHRVLLYSGQGVSNYQYPYPLEEQLQEQLITSDIPGVQQTLDQLLHSVLTSGVPFPKLKRHLIEFCAVTNRTLAKMGVNLTQLSQDETSVEPGNITQYQQLSDFMQGYKALLLTAVRQKEDQQNYALIHKVQRYLAEEDISEISLESLASALNLSPQYVSRIFKETFGKNFIDYLTNCRIDRAKTLLREGKKSIAEVAIAAGYKDPNYFCRIFKKVTGITPKDFRKIS